MELNLIYNNNCLSGMKELPEACIDMVLTSPPYDNLRSYNKNVGESWGESVWKPIVQELYRVLKDGGVAVWVVNDATFNGSESGTSFRQALHFIDCGFNLNDTMIWKKKNPMPQVKQPRYRQVFEYMFVFSKGAPKVFNPIMEKCSSAGNQYSSTCKNIGGESGRVHKDFVISNERVADNVWDIAVAQNDTGHPAVYPAELARRHISSWSNPGDIVLDPFMGSGTTALEAVKLGRKFIGFELNKDYVDMANARLKILTGPFKLYGDIG